MVSVDCIFFMEIQNNLRVRVCVKGRVSVRTSFRTGFTDWRFFFSFLSFFLPFFLFLSLFLSFFFDLFLFENVAFIWAFLFPPTSARKKTR